VPRTRERRITDYRGRSDLYLKTADRRLFSDYYSYYGDQYSGAVGEIYRSEPINRRDGHAKVARAFVKSITPEIIHPRNSQIGEVLPVRVVSQEKRGEELVLVVVVDFSAPYAFRDWDDTHRDGNTYTLVLFLESAKRLHFA